MISFPLQVNKDTFAQHFLSVWKNLDFVQLMNNGFCCTGIIPISPDRFLASLPPEINVPPESSLAEKSDEWRCLISSLRGVGVPEDAVGQTVKDIFLKT